MAHQRESIRKAIVSAVTGLTGTGANVFSGYVRNVPADSLPAIVVTTAAGEPETIAGGNKDKTGATEIRALPVTIEARAKATADMLDTLDDIAEQVEAAVTTAAAVDALVTDIRLISTGFELAAGADRPTGVCSMAWVAEYEIPDESTTTAVVSLSLTAGGAVCSLTDIVFTGPGPAYFWFECSDGDEYDRFIDTAAAPSPLDGIQVATLVVGNQYRLYWAAADLSADDAAWVDTGLAWEQPGKLFPDVELAL